MTKVRVNAYSISIDGFGAGPDQSLDNPLGVGGQGVFGWFFPTRTFKSHLGQDGGETGPDDDIAGASFDNLGAWIMGRNMFGPVRGPWPDGNWKGWWGPNPPYHVPVFVLTHHAREPLAMEGGTTFYFVTGGIHAALEQATDAAKGKDIRIGGGASTIRQYLKAGLIDSLHVAISPVLLGAGEKPFDGIDMVKLGYRCTEHIATEKAMHVTLTR